MKPTPTEWKSVIRFRNLIFCLYPGYNKKRVGGRILWKQTLNTSRFVGYCRIIQCCFWQPLPKDWISFLTLHCDRNISIPSCSSTRLLISFYAIAVSSSRHSGRFLPFFSNAFLINYSLQNITKFGNKCKLILKPFYKICCDFTTNFLNLIQYNWGYASAHLSYTHDNINKVNVWWTYLWNIFFKKHFVQNITSWYGRRNFWMNYLY